MRFATLVAAVPVIASLAAGCSGKGGVPSGAQSPAGRGSSATGGSGAGSGTTLAIAPVTGLASAITVRGDGRDVPVHAVKLTATGGSVTVKAITVTGSGTADEATDVTAVKVAVDDGDGVFDRVRDRQAGGLARFAADDGKAIVGGVNLQVRPGAPETLWIVYDLAGSADPGETLQASVAASTDVDAIDGQGRAVPAQGVPAPGPLGTVFLGDHLLLSEVCVTPTNGEFVEIFNPTAQSVDLSSYYLTDAEERPNVSVTTGATYGTHKHYYNLPAGKDFGTSSDSDFHVRFPAGATIRPGERKTVALSSDLFAANYGKSPDFEMVQDGAGDGVADMRVVGPAPTTFTAGLSNTAELVVLYTWDGAADLVQDVDLVQWGNSIGSFYVEKTGTSVDGPDQDTAATAYKGDSGLLIQDKAQPNSIGTSMKRINYTPTQKPNGNGITGEDETSELLSTTWSNLTSPSPGAK